MKYINSEGITEIKIQEDLYNQMSQKTYSNNRPIEIDDLANIFLLISINDAKLLDDIYSDGEVDADAIDFFNDLKTTFMFLHKDDMKNAFKIVREANDEDSFAILTTLEYV